MAGTSKAYWRKKGTPTKTVVTHTFGDGSQITYNQYDLYTYNPGTYPVVDQTTGVCTSRPGSDSEYFGQERTGAGTHPAGGGPGRTNESYTDKTQDYESFSGDAPGDSTTGTTKTINYKQYSGGHAGHQVDHPNTAISDKAVGSH